MSFRELYHGIMRKKTVVEVKGCNEESLFWNVCGIFFVEREFKICVVELSSLIQRDA